MKEIFIRELNEPLLTGNQLAIDFVNNNQILFERSRVPTNHLETLFRTVNDLGNEYAASAINQLEGDEVYKQSVLRAVTGKEYQYLDNEKTILAYNTAVAIGRDTEAVKRSIIFSELVAHPESFSDVQKVLLSGGLALSHYSDQIFFDEWLPLIRDSEIGQQLQKMEDEKSGSSLDVLPGTPDSTRWFTRGLIDRNKPLSKDNIKLTAYKDILPGVISMIENLDWMAEKLQILKSQKQDDFGYQEYLQAFSLCLQGDDPQTQKKKEDNMYIAWRNIDANAPVFMVAFQEYDYEDPAGVAMVPSFRWGALDSSSQATRLQTKEQALKEDIIAYLKSNNVPGADALEMTDTHYRIWSSFGGSDLIFGIASEFLPNDPDIRQKYGAAIFPDLAQQEKGYQKRDEMASKVYPPNILEILKSHRFDLEEMALHEIQAHEEHHLAAVTGKAINAFGKTANLFEEAKATLGGLVAQIRGRYKEDDNFQRKALCTLLHAAPRYMAVDGNPKYQGYVNDIRIVLAEAEKLDIFAYRDDNWHINLSNEKVREFWNRMEDFVLWCYTAYAFVTSAKLEARTKEAAKFSTALESWTGQAPKTGDGKTIYNVTITKIKESLKK